MKIMGMPAGKLPNRLQNEELLHADFEILLKKIL
jgi:hypothetical protein